MKASISEIVGRANIGEGTEVSVYRALRPLLCARCGTGIKEGELFTRRKLAGIRISPCCRECVPFETLHDSNSESPLIQFLLKPGPPADKGMRTSESKNKAFISKEVERRLGPALARCRLRKQ